MKKRILLFVFLSFSLFVFSSAYLMSSVKSETVKGSAKTGDSAKSDSWSMFGHDLNHTGFSLSSAPHEPNLQWIFTPFPGRPWSENYMVSSPAVVDGRVFIGSSSADDKRFYCLNETDGTLVWSYRTGGIITSSPAICDGRVFIGSEDGCVYCLNATNGALIWNYTTDGNVHYSSPAVADGKIFVGISWYGEGRPEKGYVYCLNAMDGSFIWRYQVPQNVYSSPAVANGKVFVGATEPGAGKVYCLNETTGENIWTYITRDHVGRSSPAVVDGRVFIGSCDHNVYCLNATDGKQIWNYTALGSIDSSPAVANGRVFIGSDMGNGYGAVYCLNETTGAEIWTYNGKRLGQILSHPAVADGMVFIGQGGPGLMALNETTGALVWSYLLAGSTTQSSPAVCNGKVFVGFGNGIFCVSSPHSLTINPIFLDNIGSAFDSPPASWSILFPNGTLRTVSSSSVTYPQVETGNYSIISIDWQGNEVVPEMPPSIFVASDTVWAPTIKCRLPTHLTIALSTPTSYIGFKVNSSGRLLDYKNTSIAGAMILMEYSVTGGEPWNAITADYTRADGSYSAVWMPSATGNYLLRAKWAGNSTYPKTSMIINLAVTSFEEKNVFSVTSNSTVSALAFNSTSRELSFTVSGPSNTTGYVKVYIAKTLIGNITDVRVYLDGNQLNYTATSLDDSWLLYFTYQHSTHQVTINIADKTPPILLISSPILGSTIRSSQIAVSWSGSDVGSGIDHYEVKLDEGNWVNVGDQTSYLFNGLSDGSHIVYVKAFDRMGNLNILQITFTVNTSLLGGPRWLDYAAIIGAVIIILSVAVFFILKRRTLNR